MLGKINHAVILYVLFAALKEDLWFCNKRITSTCWVPCPLGLLRCRDWIDRCLTSKSRLAARATDADLFQGLKCPWHGVILPAQARMLSKMGFLLTSFGCRVVQSIANHIGKKKDSPRPTSRILGIPSKSWWHNQHSQMKTTNQPHHRQYAPDSFLGNVRRRCLSHLCQEPISIIFDGISPLKWWV